MAKTIVGLFNSTAEAEKIKQELIVDGYDADQINVMANNSGSTYGSEVKSTGSDNEGIGTKIENFFSSLMGGDHDAHEHYATGVNQGGALLAVRTEDDDADEVSQWLNQHGARNIDRNAESLKGTGSYGDANSRDKFTDGRESIPVIEEELQVGKREVDRGGVRVYSHTTEKPAEAEVTLRDEKINVERREVNRPATAADFAAGSGKVIEMYAQGEEAVVGKTSRVVGEVVLGKQVSEHTEEVRDTVRRTDVDVEEVSADDEKARDYAGVTTGGAPTINRR